jgi:hypothetical protein
MTDLSPAAQAVYNAVLEICPAPADEIAAAALRAAADQVIPIKEEPVKPPGYAVGYEPAEYLQDWTLWYVRSQLFAIAAELEGTTPSNLLPCLRQPVRPERPG